MNYTFRLALRYLAGRKLRNTLTTLAIAIGVMITFGLNGLAPALEASFLQGASTAALQLDLLITREAQGMFAADQTARVNGIRGVTGATGFIARDILLPETLSLRTADGAAVDTLETYGLDPASAESLFDIILAEGRTVVSGRLLEPGDGYVLVLSEGLADGMGWVVGDTVQLPSASGTTSFEIVGLLSGSGLALGEEQIYMPLSAAQNVFNSPRQITGIAANFESGADEEAVKQAVLAELGGSYQLGSLGGGTEAWESLLQISSMIFSLFGVLALVMAGFILFNTFRTVVAERVHDIGILRAVGASRRTVTRLVLFESLLQGLSGTGLGLLAGFGLARLAIRLLNPVWEMLLSPLGDPVFTWGTYALAIGLGLIIPLLSAWLPARAASRVSPLEALRPSQGDTDRRTSGRRALWGLVLALLSMVGLVSGNIALAALGAIVFLAGVLLIGPALVQPIAAVFGRLLALFFAREGHIARGNLARQPGRAAITASTVTISLAILVAFGGLATSATDGMFGYLEKSMQADYLLLQENLVLGGGNVGAGPELADSVAALPGIAEVTTLRRVETLVDSASVQLIGIDPDTYPQISGLVFTRGEPDDAYGQLEAGRGLIVNGFFATQLGVGVGDAFTLDTPNGPQTYQVAGVGIDYLNAKIPTGYISQADMARDFNETNDLVIMTNLTPDADPGRVEAALVETARRYPAFGVLSFERLRESQTAGTDAIAYGLIAVVALLAVPSVIALANTLGINVLERTREIGVLRAVGATRRQVRRMILAESLLLVAMGAAFGILGGIWLGYLLVGAMSFIGLPLPYYFPYAGILGALAAALLFGVLAALIPARHAARLEIVKALAFE